MAEPVKIALKENDRIVLERQQGGKYAARLIRNGVDQGLLEGRVDRDTPLIIEGTGKNTSLDIPANIDFAPRVQVNTNENLRIDNGPFILAKESKRSATVQTTNTTLARPTLSFGGGDEDERFAPTQAVMGFRANAQIRNIAVEPGAPGIDIVRPNNEVVFTLSGADTLQQIAQKLGIAAPAVTAPAQPAPKPARPAPLPAGTGPNVPFEQRDPKAQLSAVQQDMIGMEADRIRNIDGLLPIIRKGQEPTPGQKALHESYDRINTAAQAFKEGKHTQQELQDFRNIVETERTNLERISRDNPEVKQVAGDIASIMTSTTRNVDRISRVNWKAPEPRNVPEPRNDVPPAVDPGVKFEQQQESIGRLATQAERFSKGSDNPESRKLMAKLATAARTAERNPSDQEAMRNLNTALSEALEGSRKGAKSGRSLTAPDEVQQIERFQQQLNGPQQQPGRKQGAAAPSLPDHVLAAAGNAVDPSLSRQQGVQSDQNTIRLGSSLPGSGGTIQIT
jgi:hypothetical protein